VLLSDYCSAMPALAIDHAAFPCFDVAATHRFYTGVLGLRLVHAQSGPAPQWNAREYLLLAYALPDGGVIDFFSFDGIARAADDGLPKDLRHLALAVATREEVLAYKERLSKADIPFWIETHEGEDVHLYATDPNGVVLELLAVQDGSGARARDEAAAKGVLDKWLALRAD
jgi:catechol 2,3-dioxygenase-like lactoylglutathione lyase family enzyme